VELSVSHQVFLSGKLSGYEFQPSQSGKTLQTIKTNINNEKNILLLSIGLLLISCSSEENKILKESNI
jgi:hypothetical protein